MPQQTQESDGAYILRYFQHINAFPDSRAAQARWIYIRERANDGPLNADVSLLRAIHSTVLGHSNFFARTQVIDDARDELYTIPPPGSRRAKIVAALSV